MSAARRGDRDHDVVLFGATGFTGGLAAEYLARHAPPTLRLGIAGRNRARLQALAAQLTELRPDSAPVAVLVADVEDAGSMLTMAESSRVVASTVGPFMLHGAALVAACAHAGTDYLDITGEPEFVDRMWLAHQEPAEKSGARMVHCCGFDSVPHDLGVWFTLSQLPPGHPYSIAAYVRAKGTISAGTYHSAIRAFGRARQGAEAARLRRARERDLQTADAEPSARRRRVSSLSTRPHRVPGSGQWALALPTIDPLVVRRSARALERYGPRFSYGHYGVVGGLPMLAAGFTAATGLFAAAQIPPLRSALLGLKSSGDGPGAERRAESWFSVQFVSTVGDGAADPIVTEVRGGDPGYGETSKMLAESALALALDELPELAGQLTPVQAMADALLTRLQSAGIRFRRLPAEL